MAAIAAALLGAPSGSVGAGLAEADTAWERRDEGHGRLAQVAPIRRAAEVLEAGIDERPDDPGARWRLLRALHYWADFTTARSTDGRRAEVLERGRRQAEEALDRLAAATGGGARLDELDAEALRARVAASGVNAASVARLHFWAAIVWGAWSQESGILSAVRRGVANRVYRYANAARALDPTLESGGIYRLLGRLHAELPRIPFVSGWVERDRAVPMLEEARAIDPEHPGNRLLLAITLLDLEPARRDEAIALLRSVAGAEPRPGERVEDLTLTRQARERLAELAANGS